MDSPSINPTHTISSTLYVSGAPAIMSITEVPDGVVLGIVLPDNLVGLARLNRLHVSGTATDSTGTDPFDAMSNAETEAAAEVHQSYDLIDELPGETMFVFLPLGGEIGGKMWFRIWINDGE